MARMTQGASAPEWSFSKTSIWLLMHNICRDKDLEVCFPSLQMNALLHSLVRSTFPTSVI